MFTTNLGEWSYWIIAIAAFGTIYGTLITAWDAFARSFVRCLRIFKFPKIENNVEQQNYLTKYYNLILITIGVGGYILFAQFTGSMIKMLELATIFSFLAAPLISYLNLKAICGDEVPLSHRPPKWLMTLSYIGLIVMVLFSAYYIYDLMLNGVQH